MTVYLAHMSYSDEDIQGLMHDLSTVGLSRRALVNKTHYGFGEDLQGENDGKTPFYITKEGADLMHEAKFGRWIKEHTFAIVWSDWEKSPSKTWVKTPLPAADRVSENLLMVTLFQSSPRMCFPGDLPPERVKMGYDLLVDEIKGVRLPEV